jgi:hypothetical protein
MLDMQYAITYSPKGTDTLLFDDVESRKRGAGSTTFDMLTRRFATTFASPSYRTSDDTKLPVSHLDNPIRQIKIKILQYNPMIYYMLQEYLVVGQCYTDVTVCYMMNQFIDKTIRIPELRNDIMNHRLVYTNYFRVRTSSTTTSSIFSYLTGESTLSYTSPTSTSSVTPLHLKKPVAVSARLSTTSSSTSDSTSSSKDSRELSLPSLESPGNSYDHITDDDDDDDDDDNDQAT